MSQTNAQQLKTIPANDIAAQMRVVVSGVDSFDNLRGSAPVPRDNKRCQRQHQPAGVDETTFSTECDRERQTGAASDHNEGCLVCDGWPSNTFMSVIVLRYTALACFADPVMSSALAQLDQDQAYWCHHTCQLLSAL